MSEITEERMSTTDAAVKDILMEKDSATIVCHICKEAITGRTINAMGKTWHPEHFTCAHCKRPITGERFHQRDGEAFCVEDYTKFYMQRCHACQEPVTDRIIQALGTSWHSEHFVCASCKRELAGTTFLERAGLPYCSDCYNAQFAPRCNACTLPITEKTIVALDKKWHQECFKCSRCGRPVTDSTFRVVDGKPVCKKC